MNRSGFVGGSRGSRGISSLCAAPADPPFCPGGERPEADVLGHGSSGGGASESAGDEFSVDEVIEVVEVLPSRSRRRAM
jgi:hypothetical protein